MTVVASGEYEKIDKSEALFCIIMRGGTYGEFLAVT
jgi:hypothetical protein